MQQFSSNGKLLISGEYLVLQGALALATPCKFGQKMMVEEKTGENNLHWITKDADGSTLEEVLLNKSDFSPFRGSLETIDAGVYDTLSKTLATCRKRNPAFLKKECSTKITNTIEFKRDWGLGSSSTFINNLAQFSNVDAFQLNKDIFGGSGYDIACAKSSKPIFFKLDEEGPVYDSVHFSPPTQEQIFFIYMNEKQNSSIAVTQFNEQEQSFSKEIEIITELSEALLFCDDFSDFMQLLDEHEEVMQFVLQQEKVKTRLFADFSGVVKSLGAWGGDFVMAVAEIPAEEIKSYFQQKGFSTIFNYREIIL
ncbi:MAG: GYDIA family GHMP kinase [Chitinophagales bacterium]